MKNLLDEIYKTKLRFVAILAVLGGIFTLALANWLTALPNPHWLALLPVGEIGSTLFGTGLLAIFFEYVDRKHGDERTDQRIREAVRREAPAIRDAVLDSFAFDPQRLSGVASAETLDRIAANAIGLRIGDEQLAQDAYADLRDQVIKAPERWRDVDVSISLDPWADGPVEHRRTMFVATIRTEYRVRPATTTLRFTCVSDLEEYRELVRDQNIASVWHFDRSAKIDPADPTAFELLQLTVDGEPRKIRRSQRVGSQTYSASLGDTASDGREVSITYTYRVLLQRHGHLLFLEFPRPTRGLHVRLDYTAAGIRRVNTLDLIASSSQARIDQSPRSVPAKVIDVTFDKAWIFPRTGVAFVWVLEEEISLN